VIADGFPEIDIATARKERYRAPGALPAVTAGRLKDDLVRRDFSMNALALDLESGVLHDPAGGERDVHDRLVRVLHDRSFIDDPTRVFRAIRLASRIGFTLETRTAEWMQSALETGAMSTVSRERVWRELFLAMDEEAAPQILECLAHSGTLKVLFGRRSNDDLRARLDAVRERLVRQPDLDRYVVYTGVLLRGDASPIDFEGSGFSQKRAKAVVEIANDLPRIEESLATVQEDRERFRIYRGISPEMLTVIGSERPEEVPHISRYHEFENFSLPLRGNDLEVPGGPHVAKALEQTREAVFSGRVAPEDARSYAREVARRLLGS
jgi:tRNA nucleotidyltransferase/poly(A) polymerase